MSTTSPSYTIHHIPPPGPTVLPLARHLCSPSPLSSILSSPSTYPLPAHLTNAILIRKAVFVEEQHCDPMEEVDDDDARSWHWVLYAPPPSDGSISPPTAAATIRLVPVNGTKGGDAHWEVKEGWGLPDYGNSDTWDGKEGYVKIGRLATMRVARGRGVGRLLVEESVRWARENAAAVGRSVSAAAHPDKDAAMEAQSEGQDCGGWKGLIGCHAQKHLEEWYHKLGFVRDNGMGEWEEDSIPHVGMWMKVEV